MSISGYIWSLILLLCVQPPVYAQTAQSNSILSRMRGLLHKEVICVWEPTPLTWIYDELADTTGQYTRDSDADGVIDRFDKEPNTPALTPVDIHGVSADTDRDGCADVEDPEPLSNINLPMQNCMNVDPEPFDITLYLDICRRVDSSSEWILPFIYFDKGEADIRPDAIPALNMIVELHQHYNLQIEVIGFSDAEAFAEQQQWLAISRAKNAIHYLVENGVSEDQLYFTYITRSVLYNHCGDEENCMYRRVEFWIK